MNILYKWCMIAITVAFYINQNNALKIMHMITDIEEYKPHKKQMVKYDRPVEYEIVNQVNIFESEKV